MEDGRGVSRTCIFLIRSLHHFHLLRHPAAFWVLSPGKDGLSVCFCFPVSVRRRYDLRGCCRVTAPIRLSRPFSCESAATLNINSTRDYQVAMSFTLAFRLHHHPGRRTCAGMRSAPLCGRWSWWWWLFGQQRERERERELYGLESVPCPVSGPWSSDKDFIGHINSLLKSRLISVKRYGGWRPLFYSGATVKLILIARKSLFMVRLGNGQ